MRTNAFHDFLDVVNPNFEQGFEANAHECINQQIFVLCGVFVTYPTGEREGMSENIFVFGILLGKQEAVAFDLLPLDSHIPTDP